MSHLSHSTSYFCFTELKILAASFVRPFSLSSCSSTSQLSAAGILSGLLFPELSTWNISRLLRVTLDKWSETCEWTCAALLPETEVMPPRVPTYICQAFRTQHTHNADCGSFINDGSTMTSKMINNMSFCHRWKFITWMKTNTARMTSWSWAQMDCGTWRQTGKWQMLWRLTYPAVTPLIPWGRRSAK